MSNVVESIDQGWTDRRSLMVEAEERIGHHL